MNERNYRGDIAAVLAEAAGSLKAEDFAALLAAVSGDARALLQTARPVASAYDRSHEELADRMWRKQAELLPEGT